MWYLLETNPGVSESARWSRASAWRDTGAESLSLVSLDSSTAGHGERQGHKLRGLPSGSQARRGHRGGDAHPSVPHLEVCVLCFQSQTWERPHSFCRGSVRQDSHGLQAAAGGLGRVLPSVCPRRGSDGGTHSAPLHTTFASCFCPTTDLFIFLI